MINFRKLLNSVKKARRKELLPARLQEGIGEILQYVELSADGLKISAGEIPAMHNRLNKVEMECLPNAVLIFYFNRELSLDDKILLESICLLAVENLSVIDKLSKASHKGWKESSRKQVKEIICHSPAMNDFMQKIDMVSPHDTTVLIQGETGTGKEVIARYVHKTSGRNSGPFITVNCAALPETFIDSALFGHVRGAFTGADKERRGFFESASGGTVFLDEIGDLPMETQSRLLRVLEAGEINPLGCDDVKKIDVRVVAASHVSLKEAVLQGHFRKDLFYRLTAFPVYLPPLRERKEDLPELIDELIRELFAKLKVGEKKLTAEFYKSALEYDWPGNVRELRNSLEKSLILSGGAKLKLVIDDSQFFFKERMFTFDEEVKQILQCALAKCGGRVKGEGGAADLLGLNPQTLYSKLRKYQIGSRL